MSRATLAQSGSRAALYDFPVGLFAPAGSRAVLTDSGSRALLLVANDAGSEPIYTIPDGWQSIAVGTPVSDPDNGLSSDPQAVSGLICVWGDLQGLNSVTVNDDLSYLFTETVAGAGGSFDYYFIDPITGETGAIGTITIAAEVVTDTAPDSFDFTDLTGVALTSTQTSDAVAITGINAATTITVSNCYYSIDGGTFVNTSGTIENNSFVRLRVDASSSYNTATTCSVTIGGVTADWVVTTEQETVYDTTPDPFSFTGITNAALNSVQLSESVTITGIDAAADITVTGCEYSINGGDFTSVAGTIDNDSSLRLRLTSSSDYETAVTATVVIGGVSVDWVVTTQAESVNTVLPVITLNKPLYPTIIQGTEYIDPGATAEDDIDGDITNRISVSGAVDIQTPGVYKLQYNVTDSDGNAALTVERYVTVLQRVDEKSIDARIYTLPSSDYGDSTALYADNTNYLVVKDIRAAYALDELQINAITATLSIDGNVIYGPYALAETVDGYVLSISHALQLSVGDEVTANVVIDGASSGRGAWDVVLQVIEREER